MNGVYSKTTFYQHVEFSGHLIDSLTLSKVIDRIQQMECDYSINDIHIGSRKHEISSINLTLYAHKEENLHELLLALAPYGALPVEKQNVRTTTVSAQDIVPQSAFSIKFPRRIRYQDRWLDIDARDPMVVAIDAEGQSARLVHISEVGPGTQVVAGTQGIEW